MITVQIILIAIGALLADADECSCSCNKQDVCDEQNALRTKLDNNTDEIQKWNRYYNLVKGLAEDWEYQFEHIMRQQLEVEINETVEGLNNATQKAVSKWNGDMMAGLESFENSLRSLREEADLLDITMEMLSDEMKVLRTEFRRIQYEGKCGVDFDNGGSNGGRNTRSVLVWPWIAAMYFNGTSGTILRCGGSVIHQRFVMTSALCVEYHERTGISLKLGLSDLKKGTHLQEYRIQSTHMHPRFQIGSRFHYRNYDYDIGLLELEEPIPFGPFVRPVCLPPREISQDESFYQPQSTAKTVHIEEYLSSPETASPTVLNLTILPQEECSRIKKEKGWEHLFPSPDLSFCAKRSSTLCPEDGSPMMQSSLEGPGTRTWTQVGITHWCRDEYFFSPRLDRLRDWVDATIKALSKV